MEMTIPVSEIFGPTLQGEGPDVGRTCLFLRLHQCPVRCPGCDTSFTWNGKEAGGPMSASQIIRQLVSLAYPQRNPGPGLIGDLGLVVSGGEPLLQYRSSVLREVLEADIELPFKWTGLETSGYAGSQKLNGPELASFLRLFSTVCLSPKITPCLHGRQTDEELERNIDDFMTQSDEGPACPLVFKFVVRDQADVDAAVACSDRHDSFIRYLPTYLMPYGNDKDTILRSIEVLIPAARRHGFRITPRLQALLWGSQRGV